MKLHYLLYLPISFLIPKDERLQTYQKIRTNYKIGKVTEANDIKTFKRNLYFNGIVHGVIGSLNILLFFCPLNVPFFILNCLSLLLNTYCVILQRYNFIRIDNTLAKCEKLESKKREILQQNLQNDDFITQNLSHSLINIKDNSEREISFEEFLNTATLKQIKEYMEYLKNIKATMDNEIMPLNQSENLRLALKRQKPNN